MYLQWWEDQGGCHLFLLKTKYGAREQILITSWKGNSLESSGSTHSYLHYENFSTPEYVTELDKYYDVEVLVGEPRTGPKDLLD